jgi:hypothetical protein
MDQYQYKPVLQNEIRVLKADSEKNLAFVLKHVNIDTNPKYAALSYPWGEPKFPRTMKVDKCTFNITENLYDALRQVTSHWAHNRLRSLGKCFWIDAICIDQKNDQEKSQQIRLMRRIYEQAGSIFVWLSQLENEERHKLAMRMLADFYHRCIRALKKNRPHRSWWWPNKPVTKEDDINTFLLSTPASDRTVYDIEGSPTRSAWIGICSIVGVSRWSRTWVFQEANVPDNFANVSIRGGLVIPRTRKVTLLYGPSLISWLELLVTANVSIRLRTTTVDLETDLLVTLLNNFATIDRLRNSRAIHQKRPFLDLLQTFRHTLCKNPRDKVYAPLGLASDDIIEKIILDYQKAPQAVYMEVVENRY